MPARVAVPALHDAVQAKLREADQLYTSGRRELVEVLAGFDRPVTIYELLETRPKLTQSSVYRNLAGLVELEAVQKVVGADDRVRYEFAEDIIGHHHHLICTECGRVDDFRVPRSTERSLDTALQRAADAAGFAVAGHRLDAVGLCAACAA
jgi:Fur family ferric uptake transcriptional regulator